jgi:hypothetical protein
MARVHGPLNKILGRGIDEPRFDGVHLEVGADRPAIPELWRGTVIDPPGGHGDHAVLIEPDVGRHIERHADTEKPFEAMGEWSATDKLRQIDVCFVRAGPRPVNAQMPLAEHRGGVSLLLQKGRHGQTTRAAL